MLGTVCLLAPLLPQVIASSRGGEPLDLYWVFVVVAMAAIGLLLPSAMWIIVRQGKRTPVFYLRAFRSDTRASRLRSFLKAALGEQFRLCGIRPPNERSSWLSRLMLTGLIGLRYVGSEHFEMEAANHNWMARLFASYTRARFVFIDLRDMTVHVEAEVRLSYLAMGPARCVFIVDESRPLESWLSVIAATLGQPLTSLPPLHMLAYPGDASVDSAVFVGAAHLVIEQVPEGLAGLSEEALAFVRSHVSPPHWKTPFWETAWGQMLVASLLLTPVLFLLGQIFHQTEWLAFLPAWLVTGVLAASYFVAWRRAWQQGRVEHPFRPLLREPSPLPGLRLSLLLSSGWMVCTLFLLLVMLPALNAATRHGEKQLTVNHLHRLQLGLLRYANDHEDQIPAAAEWPVSLAKYFNGPPQSVRDASGKLRMVTELEALVTDRWGRPISYEPNSDRTYMLRSSGPDKQSHTQDDICIDEMGLRSEGQGNQSK